jgi:hypothetical protein
MVLMIVITTLADTLIGTLAGIALVKFSDPIAAYVKDTLGNSILQDVGNPWIYKILGVITIGFSLFTLLTRLISLPQQIGL